MLPPLFRPSPLSPVTSSRWATSSRRATSSRWATSSRRATSIFSLVVIILLQMTNQIQSQILISMDNSTKHCQHTIPLMPYEVAMITSTHLTTQRCEIEFISNFTNSRVQLKFTRVDLNCDVQVSVFDRSPNYGRKSLGVYTCSESKPNHLFEASHSLSIRIYRPFGANTNETHNIQLNVSATPPHEYNIVTMDAATNDGVCGEKRYLYPSDVETLKAWTYSNPEARARTPDTCSIFFASTTQSFGLKVHIMKLKLNCDSKLTLYVGKSKSSINTELVSFTCSDTVVNTTYETHWRYLTFKQERRGSTTHDFVFRIQAYLSVNPNIKFPKPIPGYTEDEFYLEYRANTTDYCPTPHSVNKPRIVDLTTFVNVYGYHSSRFDPHAPMYPMCRMWFKSSTFHSVFVIQIHSNNIPCSSRTEAVIYFHDGSGESAEKLFEMNCHTKVPVTFQSTTNQLYMYLHRGIQLDYSFLFTFYAIHHDRVSTTAITSTTGKTTYPRNRIHFVSNEEACLDKWYNLDGPPDEYQTIQMWTDSQSRVLEPSLYYRSCDMNFMTKEKNVRLRVDFTYMSIPCGSGSLIFFDGYENDPSRKKFECTNTKPSFLEFQTNVIIVKITVYDDDLDFRFTVSKIPNEDPEIGTIIGAATGSILATLLIVITAIFCIHLVRRKRRRAVSASYRASGAQVHLQRQPETPSTTTAEIDHHFELSKPPPSYLEVMSKELENGGHSSQTNTGQPATSPQTSTSLSNLTLLEQATNSSEAADLGIDNNAFVLTVTDDTAVENQEQTTGSPVETEVTSNIQEESPPSYFSVISANSNTSSTV